MCYYYHIETKRTLTKQKENNMTNLQYLFQSAPSLGCIIGYSSVWNFHGADHLDNLYRKKGTNLYKAVEQMKKDGLTGSFTLHVDQIGRSAHSASRVVIIEGITNCEEMGKP